MGEIGGDAPGGFLVKGKSNTLVVRVLVEVTDAPGDQSGADSADEAQPYLAPGGAAPGLGHPLPLLDLLDGPLGVGEELLPVRSEQGIPPVFVEKGDAQLLLQCGHGVAQVGLSDIEGVSGPGEAPGLGDGLEIVELIQIHGAAASCFIEMEKSGAGGYHA